MKINYDLELEKILKQLDNKPTLLLHSCCGPCSSYVLEYLSKYFKITILYYNPNIDSKEEFKKRLNEQKRLIKEMNLDVNVIDDGYNYNDFDNVIKGLENEPEGGNRCFKCYRLRLLKTVKMAEEKHFDFFGTTLSISPFKNADKLNSIGLELENEYGIKYLVSDFKKKNGYKRSIELSRKYNLYRQDYCGCIYSKLEREKIKNRELVIENV